MFMHKFRLFSSRFIWTTALIIVCAIAFAADFKFIHNIYQRVGWLPLIALIISVGAFGWTAIKLLKRYRSRLAAVWQAFTRLLCRRYLLAAVIMAGLSLLLRALWLFLFQVNEFESDFEAYFIRASDYANGTYPVDDYSALFPHVFGFSYVLGAFMKLFGSTLLTAQLFNAALYILSLVLLAFLFPARSYPGRFLISVAIISFWPSLIYFTMLANTEYLFIVCWLGFLLVLKRIFQSRSFIITAIMTALLLTVAALSNFVRPIGSIVVIIFIIMLVLAPATMKWLHKASLLVIGIAVYVGLSTLLSDFVSQHIHLKAAAAPIGFNLFVGTNPTMQGEDLGLWNAADSLALGQAYRESGDAQAAHGIMLRQGVDRLQQWFASGQGGFFLANKIKTAWGTDSWALQLAESHVNSYSKHEYSKRLYAKLHVPLIAIGDFIYALFLTISAWLLWNWLRQNKFNPHGLLPAANALFLIGTFLMLLLVESAPRYHLPGFIALLLVITSPDDRPVPVSQQPQIANHAADQDRPY